MDPIQTQEAAKSIDGVWNILTDIRILYLLSLYAVGMGLKVIKAFPSRFIPATLTLVGPVLGAFIFDDLGHKKGALIGLGIAVVCVYFNQILIKTFPDNKIVQILAGEFDFADKPQPPTPNAP